MLVSCIKLHSELHFFKSFFVLECLCSLWSAGTKACFEHADMLMLCPAQDHGKYRSSWLCDTPNLHRNCPLSPDLRWSLPQKKRNFSTCSIYLSKSFPSNSSNWAQLSLVLRQQIQFDDVGHRCRPFDSITRGINQGLKASRPQLDINYKNL